MGFKEGALERKRPGNPVRDLLGASSVPAMMPWWGEGHWETLCRPASGPALFRDEGTVLHEAEQEQSPLGQTTRLQLWLPPPHFQWDSGLAPCGCPAHSVEGALSLSQGPRARSS